MKIPDDIYYRVLDIATSLVNSSESFDRKEQWAQYNELREICETEAASGRAHPFLFETLADFTDDPQMAISLYSKGLEVASQGEATAYRASINFALAERFRDIGDAKLAYEHALRADEEAKHLDDLDLRRKISQFLLHESKNT
jgi:hypothetical protein